MSQNLTLLDIISEKDAELLRRRGIKTIDQLANTSVDYLVENEGIKVSKAEELISKAYNCLHPDEPAKGAKGTTLTSKYSMKTINKREAERKNKRTD